MHSIESFKSAKGIKIIMKAGFERLLAIACVKNLNQSVMVYFNEL